MPLLISGGQTGADQAGWRAAKACGIPTGGWMPLGFKTEEGHRPEYAETYGAKEHNSSGYPPRTKANLHWCCMTILFGDPESKGSRLLYSTAGEFLTPRRILSIPSHDAGPTPGWIEGHILETKPKVINVAGNRESSSPGIGEWVERYMLEVFRLLGYPK
jgi:hypothetical protein